jgi:hypothetical protein
MSASLARNRDSEQATAWLAGTLEGADCRAMERYLGDIQRHLDGGKLGDALRMSAALPEMCSMLEHPQMKTSTAHCVCWCDAWVASDAQFARSVSRSLLAAARYWYQRRGAYDLTVQYNLGRVMRC